MQKHNVFISYHHDNDQRYRDEFERMFGQEIYISKSVQMGDIAQNLQTETIRQKIRDEYLKDSTVTIVLIGSETWKRKHVDWEIGSSIRKTQYNSRSGLIGIMLPTHNDYNKREYTKSKIPPRLHYNTKCGFAKIYNWTNNKYSIKKWIDEAFNNRGTTNPDNSYPSFVNNRTGEGWQ